MTETPERLDLTAAVHQARRGFKSDVAQLVSRLAQGFLLVPLARSVAGVPIGEQVEAEEVKLSPHLIPDDREGLHVPLFTNEDILLLAGEHLRWRTDGEELQTCTLPACIACDLALDLLDLDGVVGVVINPGDESELLLTRAEIASIAQGRALPLVGYVNNIAHEGEGESLVAELDEPLPPELTAEIERCVRLYPHVAGYRVERTFNAERDLEPHLTLTVEMNGNFATADAIGQALANALEGKLPPPGYVDILFETPQPKS